MASINTLNLKFREIRLFWDDSWPHQILILRVVSAVAWLVRKPLANLDVRWEEENTENALMKEPNYRVKGI